MSLIENERTKLLATALNNTAVATVVTAVIGPIAGFFYGLPTVSSRWWFLFWLLWLLVGIALHLIGQSILGQTSRMTGLEIYLVVAPLVLLAIGMAAAYWWLHRPYPEDGRHKSH